MGGPVVSEERRKAFLRKDMPVFHCINEVRYASRILDYAVGRNFVPQLGSYITQSLIMERNASQQQ
jgi:hypothetical protein